MQEKRRKETNHGLRKHNIYWNLVYYPCSYILYWMVELMKKRNFYTLKISNYIIITIMIIFLSYFAFTSTVDYLIGFFLVFPSLFFFFCFLAMEYIYKKYYPQEKIIVSKILLLLLFAEIVILIMRCYILID